MEKEKKDPLCYLRKREKIIPEVSGCPFYSSSWAETAVGPPVSTASTTMSGNETASSFFVVFVVSLCRKERERKK